MPVEMTPKCLAQSMPGSGDLPHSARGNRDEYFKHVQWSADGTCLIATSTLNNISTFVVPADLLTSREGPLELASYCTVPSFEPVNTVVGFPLFSLQDPNIAFVLSSLRDHPIRLNSALNGHLASSYPLVNPMTEEYITPHSLTFTSTGENFVTGSDTLISTFDTSRPGQEPVTACQTGPRSKSRSAVWNLATSMTGIVSALAIEPASNILAAGTFTRQVALYAANGQGECLGSFSVDGNEADKHIGGRGITQLCWSPCGRYLYIAERKSDGIMIYDIRQTGQLLAWTEGRDAHTNQRLSIDISCNSDNDSYEIWAGGIDGKVRMWKGAHLQEGVVRPSFEFQAHSDPVTSSVVHRTGGVIATSSAQQYIAEDNFIERQKPSDYSLKIWSV